jgi:alkylated DNA nucleotide flippase Atl1
MDLTSHPTTRTLVDEPSPLTSRAYKQREDLLDACICAWTAALWHRKGTERCQVLGDEVGLPLHVPAATIVAPARPQQRLGGDRGRGATPHQAVAGTSATPADGSGWRNAGIAPHGRIAGTSPKLDLAAAAEFLATVPTGMWTSYGDVAVAAGRSPNAAQGIAAWIGARGHQLSNVHRVLNASGQISPGWKPAGPGLPADAAQVEAKLRSEGIRFVRGHADHRQRWQP